MQRTHRPTRHLACRFGSKADICSAQAHVRFTPNSDRESGLPQIIMSALPPKADMCGALAHVCFGTMADIRLIRSNEGWIEHRRQSREVASAGHDLALRRFASGTTFLRSLTML